MAKRKNAAKRTTTRAGGGNAAAKAKKKTPRATGARKPAKPKPAAANPAHNAPPVTVRMYRQGLGDCFLLTFGAGDAARHMLIDCGTLGTKTTAGNTMERVVANIREITNDHLTVLIATHEHKDHVSGFRSRRDDFEQITVDHVWLAWTEDHNDDLARSIAVYKQDLTLALGATVSAIVGNALNEPDEDGDNTSPDGSDKTINAALAARDLLGFAGDVPMLGADKFAETIDEAMTFIRDGFKVTPAYHKPGVPPIELKEIPGFRFYVLGPPRDRQILGDLGDHGSSHLYGLHAAALALKATNQPLSSKQKDEWEVEMPFDLRFRIDSKNVGEAFPDYEKKGAEWRKVDHEWLQAVADLALQLDSLTNNTSLAIAIERIADGRVLLFPADAQQGNWLSWHDPSLKWTVQDSRGASRTVTAEDLLNRTVFYKVGHHASHNATAKAKGLELMKRKDELTAFIPVDRQVALKRHPKGSWKMPARPLYRRLLEQCDGRVVRSDIEWARNATDADDKETEKDFIGIASKQEWAQWVQSQNAAKHVTFTKLYAQYELR